MSLSSIFQTPEKPWVAGSIGNSVDLAATDAKQAANACDLVEIRLDLLDPGDGEAAWRHLDGLPMLFTARRPDEGGGRELDDGRRSAMLSAVLGRAACVDIEVASISAMRGLIDELAALGLPWVASFHDFGKLPATRDLEAAAKQASDAGAAVFKAAAMLHSPADLARLAEFQLADQGIPVATMGMGALAPVSRLLCAQCGSVLNYGYLGSSPTAPGQWDAALLKQAISRLAPWRA